MRARLAVLAVVAGAFVGVNAALDATATYAERHLGAYLWKNDDYLRLFSAAYHEGRGARRLYIYGPSEAREAFLPEEFEHVVPEFSPYQGAQSFGTLEDLIVVLEYLEGAYGRSAVPAAILLGITPRFVANIRGEHSPLLAGIDKYSPHFNVVRLEGGGPRLERKTLPQRLRAHLALARLQPDRYRRGVFAVARQVFKEPAPALAAYDRRLLRSGKYVTRRIGSEANLRRWLVEPGSHWERVRAWSPERDRARVTAEFGRLLRFTGRHGIRLFVVNLPEISWNRDLYSAGHYERYLSLVRSAIGDTPFLDLRMFLTDDEFYDEAHATWAAGIRVSRATGAFVASTLGPRP